MLSLSCTLILLTSVEAGAMVGVCAVVVVVVVSLLCGVVFSMARVLYRGVI